MYGSLFHRYGHASKGSEVARSTLSESRGLAEILFRINGKEKGIGAVIGRTVSLFKDKVEQAIELVTPAKALPENIKWDGTGGVLISIANLVNNLNSTDNSQILISKEVDRFIKGFAFSIPFIFSSNSAYGTSSFGANHTSLKGHEYSTLNAKQEQALKMVKGGDYTVMSGLQEFAILDNTTGSVILASEVGNTPKEGEKFLIDIIDGKSFTNAENNEKGNKGKIIPVNFLTENKKSDKISGNTNFNPLNKNMGTKQRGEKSQSDRAPDVVREASFTDRAASTMAETNARAMGVLDGNSPESRREAVFDKYSEKRGEVTKMIQSGNYFVSGGTFSELELRDSFGTKIKFSEFASSVEEGMNFINVTERTLSKTISEAPMGVLTGGKEEDDKKVAKGPSKGFSHSLSGGGANGKIVLEDDSNFHFDISGGVVGFQNLKDFYISLGAQLAKVVDLGDGQKGGLTISIDTKNLGQKELKMLGILTSDIGKDGRANIGIGYGSSNVEKYGKNIDFNTYAVGVGYEHFVASNIINAIQGAIIYSSTGDVLDVNTTQLVERSANFYRVSEVITNLRGAKRTKGTGGVKFNLGDPHDKLSLNLGVDHRSYGGTLSSTTEPLIEGSYSHIWGKGDNNKLYLSGEVTGSFQKGTVGYDYKTGPLSFGPESSIIHREGEKVEGQGLLSVKYSIGGTSNDTSGHAIIDESKGRPELTTDYLLNNNGFYPQMKSSLDPQYKEEKVTKRIFEASNLPAGYEINGETLSFDTGVNNLTGAVDSVMPNNGMAGHFSVSGNKLVISNISTLTPGPTYKVSLTKADGTFVVIEIPTHEGSVIFDNFRIASNVSAANKTAYMNGTKTFDQIAAADTTPPTTPTLSITDKDSSTGTAEAGYTNQARVNLSVNSTDTVGVTGWFISERSSTDPATTKPSPTAGGWSSTQPATHMLSATGSRTIDVFTKDAEGNVSERGSETIIYDPANNVTNKSLTTVNTNSAINETINFEKPVKIISVSGTSILNISTTNGSFISSLQVTGTAGSSSGTQTKIVEVQDRAGNKKVITVTIMVNGGGGEPG